MPHLCPLQGHAKEGTGLYCSGTEAAELCLVHSCMGVRESSRNHPVP